LAFGWRAESGTRMPRPQLCLGGRGPSERRARGALLAPHSHARRPLCPSPLPPRYITVWGAALALVGFIVVARTMAYVGVRVIKW
jgi:hypothetical protein